MGSRLDKTTKWIKNESSGLTDGGRKGKSVILINVREQTPFAFFVLAQSAVGSLCKANSVGGGSPSVKGTPPVMESCQSR